MNMAGGREAMTRFADLIFDLAHWITTVADAVRRQPRGRCRPALFSPRHQSTSAVKLWAGGAIGQ